MNINALMPVETARLPQVYIAACSALEKCTRIDECKDWADKAEALASYAKQAKDESLRKMADRIQARAIRRAGELLKQIEPARGKQERNEDGTIRDGTVPNGRTQAAAEAGLSERQRKTALRVANIPEEVFNEAVDIPDPLTVTQLAELGKESSGNTTCVNNAHFRKATAALGNLREFAAWCQKNDPSDVIKGIMEHEIAPARDYVHIIDAWLDAFVTRL